MQQTPIQQAIEILEEKWKALKEMDLLGVLLPNEYDYKTEEIMATQLRLSSLLPAEQQYIQQHAEGFAEWIGKNAFPSSDSNDENCSWRLHADMDGNIYTTSKLYTKYIEYINTQIT